MSDAVHPPEENRPKDTPPPRGAGERPTIPAAEFSRVQASEDFAGLKKAFRGFAFPMTVVFIVWYFAFVLSSTLLVDFMSTRIVGYITVGKVFGLLQFVSTFLITWLYMRHMNKNVDPLATDLREELEGSAA